MRLVYTKENRFDVSAMRAFLESHGVPTLLKNEFTSSVMGEVPFFETWPEIWVVDELYDVAAKLVAEQQEPVLTCSDWLCRECNEESPGTFDFCWQCGQPSTRSN